MNPIGTGNWIRGIPFRVTGGLQEKGPAGADLIGLIFRLWPARSAARRDPVEALRHA